MFFSTTGKAKKKVIRICVFQFGHIHPGYVFCNVLRPKPV